MSNRKLIESLCFDFDSKYLNFELSENNNPATWIINVMSEDDYCLGRIKWYAQWRQYAFYPEVTTIFEKNCLGDITKFVILMNEQQKKGIKPENPQTLITELTDC